MAHHSETKAAYKAIGYTNDFQQVFMTQDGQSPEGRPMEFTTVWSVDDAFKVAEAIMTAVHKCKKPPLLPARSSRQKSESAYSYT